MTLVENAVKHGLGATTAPVTIGIRGRCERGTLHLCVTDRASRTTTHRSGASIPSTGIGLKNAQARLTTRFGPGASLTAGAVEGGWDSIVSIPMVGPHG